VTLNPLYLLVSVSSEKKIVVRYYSGLFNSNTNILAVWAVCYDLIGWLILYNFGINNKFKLIKDYYVAMDNQKNSNMTKNALKMTTGLLLSFAAAFFIYYGMNTMNDPVFSIDFLPYHLAGQLLARGNLQLLTNYADSGGFFATSGPFLETFHKYFYPDSTYATRWVYTPAYLWLFRPLAGFDFPTASRIWLAFNAVLTLLAVWLLWVVRRYPDLSPELKHLRFAWFTFLALTFQPMLSNLWHGQVTGLIVVLFLLSYWLLKREKNFWSGFVLGLIVPFKFYPALFVFYFIWRREWRVVIGSLTAMLLIAVISFGTVGWQANWEYIQVVLSEISGGGVAAFNNQSISGFLMHVFTQGDVYNWLDITEPAWISTFRIVIVLVMIAAAGWVMQRRSSQRERSDSYLEIDLSLVILIMLLVSPITWYHYYMWLLFPLTVLFDHFLRSGEFEGQQVIWYALAYALVVVEGVIVLRPIAEQALQNVWLLRLLLSQSFFGSVIVFGLLLRANGDA